MILTLFCSRPRLLGYNVSADEKIRAEVEARSLTRNPELQAWLEEELREAASLQRQCRTALRRVISTRCGGRRFLRYVATLPLPRAVLNYVVLAEKAWDTM